jgi:RecB family exonuclease
VITPRRTRLVRVADLHAFRRAIAILSVEGPLTSTRSRVVVVPTRGAARQLRRTIEGRTLSAARAVVLPDFVTREQLYDRLWARLANPPRRLTAFERGVMVRAAADEAAAAGAAPPFHLRPGLVAEVVRFYDQLRRQGQSVTRFEELLADSLAGDTDLDRGAERMLRQTRFLAAVYRAYEARVARLGCVDEHALREHVIQYPAADPVRHVVVTVADWIADPSGLYRADFDLLTRLPALEAIDLVVTEELLASGLHQRVHDWLPGIEEVDDGAIGVPSSTRPPRLLAPIGSVERPVFVNRDREEELVAIARRIKTSTGVSPEAFFTAPGTPLAGPQALLDRIAVVFKRPLPYLYLAREVFAAAGIAYQTFDALPLAAEPFAAALDVVLEFVSSQFRRDAIVALLRSPHFQFASASPFAIAALDRALSDARYLGELDRLRQLAQDWKDNGGALPVLPALHAAIDAAEALQPLLDRAPASAQLTRLASFLASRLATASERELRARAAVIDILESLAAAHAEHDDREATIEEIAPDLRRWIEDETFAPETADAGLQLLDAQAARYGDFDDLVIIGLIEGEWPERPRRNIFYPPGLLAALGWPSEKDRRGAATAAFVDLLRSSSERVTLSTFTLDDEALVEPSSLVDDVGRARLAIDEVEIPKAARVFLDEALSLDPPAIDAFEGDARRWASARLARTAAADARYHGQAGPQRSRQLSVSAIETYLTCPFKFFAQYVLRLEEEPDDDEVMDPKKQGQFIHEVFQSFFATWQARGHRAITPDNLDTARAIFAEIVETHLAPLPPDEAALERTRLLGSPVAAGLAEIVFRMEAERPVDVVERLLEYKLEGEFDFAGPDGPRRVALRGVADRLDLLADGTIRLIDYKLSSAPTKARALQLPIYGLCAEQRLQSHNGRKWTLGEATYIAFRGPKRVHPLFTARADRGEVLDAAQEKLIGAVDGIERGEFPPTPIDLFFCGFCSFAAVCRKDYVGDV